VISSTIAERPPQHQVVAKFDAVGQHHARSERFDIRRRFGPRTMSTGFSGKLILLR
jgi:hypothetical protein